MNANALFRQSNPPDPDGKTNELVESIRTLSERLDKADRWFSDNGPEHPRYQRNGFLADQISKDLGRLTARAYEMGLYWDGKALVPWADAFNPAAIAGQPPNPNVVEDAAKALQGRIIEPITPPAQPAGGSFSGTVAEDWSDIG